MKRTLVVSAFVLSVSLACFVADVVTPPPPAIPTFDSNSISTFVVQTAQALALSATATQTSPPPGETPSEIPSPTATWTFSPTATSFTLAPSLTNTALPSLTPAVTVIYVPVTNTSAPATKTSAPPTKTPIPATKTALPSTTVVPAPATNTNVPPSFTSTATSFPPAAPTETSAPVFTFTPVPTFTLTLAPTNTPAASCPQTNVQFEARVVELINIERANAGLPALNDNPQLTAAAQLHSADMACNNYFSHTGRDGSTFSERARRQGYNMSYGGENIAAGYSSPEAVVQGWMNSPGHKANILGANYADVGVGYAYFKNSSYGVYWTAVFGSQ